MCGGSDSHQYVQAGGFEQGDLVGDGQRGEAGQLLGELHRLDDALGGQLAELVPETDVQSHAVLRAVALMGNKAELLMLVGGTFLNRGK